MHQYIYIYVYIYEIVPSLALGIAGAEESLEFSGAGGMGVFGCWDLAVGCH